MPKEIKGRECTMIIHDKNNYMDMMYKLLNALGYKDMKKNTEDSIVSMTGKKDGKTYAEVANETGASTATISRVNRSLNYGNASYDKVFARLEEKNKA